jgi:hypothetical protein
MPKRLLLFLWCACPFALRAGGGHLDGGARFHARIRPILGEYCFDCHADGVNKGNVALDESDAVAVRDRALWAKALKMLRAGLMPPAKRQARPTREQRQLVANWIKYEVFGIDPQHPDPGRVTVRRLNRAEYRNTVRDLLGVEFEAESQFPPDDTGYGFDNIGDVLTMPPMLLEKYLAAANQVVAKAVPTQKTDSNSAKYARFFPKPIPEDAAARQEYAMAVLRDFASRAFRRPVDDKTLLRLVSLAEGVYEEGGKSFEAGVGDAMVAVLASPRFLFREEQTEPGSVKEPYPFIDEYSLASRLSYFLWSSMPDAELLRLAGEGNLRKNLSAQVTRMLTSPRSKAFTRNFTGQWLRTRDIASIPIESRFVLAREDKFSAEAERDRQRFWELRRKPEDQLSPEEREERDKLRDEFRHNRQQPLRSELTSELRAAMREETERVFGYVLHEDRSVLELLNSDYTFLNHSLAEYYGISNVIGSEMRLVKLPQDSPRGGVLTEGTVLVTTSNPTRTSPVKRGLFILDSVLGIPVPPPPANIPPLEDATRNMAHHTLSLRETLAVHRASPLCSSCHDRMDPLGLAFENFNAMGMWRNEEFNQSIDASGHLVTGEPYSNVKELEQVLVENHAEDFYRTLTEKLLVYALGRGLEDYDVETVDQIVARLEKAGGRPSELLAGIVESAPFQRSRQAPSMAGNLPEQGKLAQRN